MKIVDLSHTIETLPESLPSFMRVEVSYSDHAEGAREMEQAFGLPPRLLRDGEGPAGERMSIGTHAATHVDAPWHYNSHIQGAPAATIDQLGLDRFYGPGVVVDATGKPDGDPVTAEEMQAGIAAAGHTLAPGDIVLVHCGADVHYHEPDYMVRGCGVTAEATLWLYDQGIRLMGIDAWGWDAPLDRQAEQAMKRDQPGIFWAAHQIDRDYSQIERLANLSALPRTGFTVACFPLKIKGASAGLARAVAFVDA
jgi:kynurenine formamidase